MVKIYHMSLFFCPFGVLVATQRHTCTMIIIWNWILEDAPHADAVKSCQLTLLFCSKLIKLHRSCMHHLHIFIVSTCMASMVTSFQPTRFLSNTPSLQQYKRFWRNMAYLSNTNMLDEWSRTLSSVNKKIRFRMRVVNTN